MRTTTRWIGPIALTMAAALVLANGERPAQAMKIRPLQDKIIVKVVDALDPDGLGRIKVAFPVMPETSSSPMPFRTEWARLVVPLTASTAEAFVLPEVDDEVVVGFEDGDTARPLILGRVWNGRTPPGLPGPR
jgi:uncharacterized protein involved in type VI secretion and phage assembly